MEEQRFMMIVMELKYALIVNYLRKMITKDTYMKRWYKKKGYPAHHIELWTTKEKLKLIKLIEVDGIGGWFWIGKLMKRSPGACKSRYAMIKREREKVIEEVWKRV